MDPVSLQKIRNGMSSHGGSFLIISGYIVSKTSATFFDLARPLLVFFPVSSVALFVLICSHEKAGFLKWHGSPLGSCGWMCDVLGTLTGRISPDVPELLDRLVEGVGVGVAVCLWSSL